MFGFQPSPAVQLAILRLHKANKRADEAHKVLDLYLEADRPFVAFAADALEHEQERNIWRGPSQ